MDLPNLADIRVSICITNTEDSVTPETFTSAVSCINLQQLTDTNKFKPILEIPTKDLLPILGADPDGSEGKCLLIGLFDTNEIDEEEEPVEELKVLKVPLENKEALDAPLCALVGVLVMAATQAMLEKLKQNLIKNIN